MIHNRASNAAQWELDKLTAILIRQFKRPLTERDISLTEAEIQHIAGTCATRQFTHECIPALQTAMADVIAESHAQIAGWNLTYARSLATDMNDMPGWESTAEFLELANEKGNAELRISAGASLLALLGDTRHAGDLWTAYQHGKHDPEDVDAVIARRALAFVSDINEHAPDWETLTGAWLDALTSQS